MGDAVSPEAAFDAVANELLPEPGVDEGTGFGSNPGLRVDGHIFAMPERCADLVEEGEAEAFRIGKRRMTEWISVGRPDAARWVELAGEARAFVAD